ncbi:MAG TPA: 2-phosphosulfolactate phosphatase [Dehalococcoidia bacterium]|nr:2-phosphosulfolactate phosphatase [Dehalococcoidia bacterium]
MVTRVDVSCLPADAGEREADCFIVVDLFRATTTIATLFAVGLERLTVASTIQMAREIAERQNALLLGEEGGIPPEGFDHGNSPVEAATLSLEGRPVVLSTTNGTGAICSVASRGAVLSGALANLTAVAAAAAQFETVSIVCAGNAYGEAFSLEDLGGAGAVVGSLVEHSPGVAVGDTARLAELAWLKGGTALLAGSEHADLVRELGLGADIEYALRSDTSEAAPTVTDWGDGWAELREVTGV